MYNSSIGRKILHFSLTKIIIGLLLCSGIIALVQLNFGKFLTNISLDKDIKSLLTGMVIAVLVLITYIFLFKIYERRKITELSNNRFFKNVTTGIFLGTALQSLTILVIFLKGGYSIVTINPVLFLVPPFTMAITSAIIEEILLRGIIFRITEEKLGSYFALAVSSLIFGALHLANPNTSVIATIGLAIQAGLLLAAAFIYTRNLWFPIAIHFSWNFTQSAIFGANVSGNTMSKTLITSKIEGATWFTGGLFGPEGSIQATIFCLIASIILLTLSHKDGKIIKPFWRIKTTPLIIK